MDRQIKDKRPLKKGKAGFRQLGQAVMQPMKMKRLAEMFKTEQMAPAPKKDVNVFGFDFSAANLNNEREKG